MAIWRPLLRGVGLALALALLSSPLHGQTAQTSVVDSSSLEGEVVGITDGDTLTLLVGPDQIRIRLAQIDAPESRQPHGASAKRALSALAFGRQARVEVVDRDRYGRSVAEVFVGDVHVNFEMVRLGHAWAYTEYSRSLEVVHLEDEARAANRGLWALPLEQRDPPWRWRRQKRTRREPSAASAPLACGNRHSCKEMESCAQARFYFERCALTRLDGDRDGVPCEELCPSSR